MYMKPSSEQNGEEIESAEVMICYKANGNYIVQRQWWQRATILFRWGPSIFPHLLSTTTSCATWGPVCARIAFTSAWSTAAGEPSARVSGWCGARICAPAHPSVARATSHLRRHSFGSGRAGAPQGAGAVRAPQPDADEEVRRADPPGAAVPPPERRSAPRHQG